MLIFLRQSLAFVAVPKTATTSIENALRPHADIISRRSRKHITASRLNKQIRPFIRDSFDVELQSFAVMRGPEDSIGSWYRYRCRDEIRDRPQYAGGLSFDAFVDALLSDDPPPCARLKDQRIMMFARNGDLLIDHLFAYERLDVLASFLSDRFETTFAFAPTNASPAFDLELSARNRDRLREALAAEFDLHARLLDAGGRLSAKE